jgi:hypothetical protein
MRNLVSLFIIAFIFFQLDLNIPFWFAFAMSDEEVLKQLLSGQHDASFSLSTMMGNHYDCVDDVEEAAAAWVSASEPNRAEEKWCAVIETLLRNQRVAPDEIRMIMQGIRAGGDSRMMALSSVEGMV